MSKAEAKPVYMETNLGLVTIEPSPCELYAAAVTFGRDGLQMVWLEGYDSMLTTEVDFILLRDFKTALLAQAAHVQKIIDIIQEYGLDVVQKAIIEIRDTDMSEHYKLFEKGAVYHHLIRWNQENK